MLGASIDHFYQAGFDLKIVTRYLFFLEDIFPAVKCFFYRAVFEQAIRWNIHQDKWSGEG